MYQCKITITDRSVWTASELEKDVSWRYRLTKVEQGHLDDAVRNVAHLSLGDIAPGAFKLAGLGRRIERIRNAAHNDRGVFLIHGLPIKNKSIEDLERMLVGISSHLGVVLKQYPCGRIVDRLQDTGSSYEDIGVQGGQTSACLSPHCDTGDFLILLCVNPAKKDGITHFVSSCSIFNEILHLHPEHLDLLFRGFHYNIRDRGPPGKWANVTKERVPVFVNDGEKVSTRFNLKAILTAEEWGLTPPLTPLERQAVICVGEIACGADLSYGIKLKTGDLLILNNRTTFHYRSSFVDGVRKRMLLRAWVDAPGFRELPDVFTNHWNTGPRGGIYQRGSGESAGKARH